MAQTDNVKLIVEKLEDIKKHPGAGDKAISVIAKAYKDRVFSDLVEYIRFIVLFHDLLESGDRDKYPLCSNELYALEQINIWLMMEHQFKGL